MPLDHEQHKIKSGGKYFLCAVACLDTETNKVIADLEADYTSEILEESGRYILDLIMRRWPAPRYTGHALNCWEVYSDMWAEQT